MEVNFAVLRNQHDLSTVPLFCSKLDKILIQRVGHERAKKIIRSKKKKVTSAD